MESRLKVRSLSSGWQGCQHRTADRRNRWSADTDEDLMSLLWNVLRVVIAAATIVAVAELSKRFPRYAALLLSLPLISVLGFLFSWFQFHDVKSISQIARETLVLVPLGLVFFVPVAFADRLGLSFWTSFAIGVALTVVVMGLWLLVSPA